MIFEQPPPPEDDSPDLTDEEIAQAALVLNPSELETAFRDVLHPEDPRKRTFQLCRRKPHMYCRLRLSTGQEPDKVFLFRLDWLGV